MKKSITLLSLMKDTYHQGTRTVNDIRRNASQKWEDTIDDINMKRKGLKYITRDDVKRTVTTASKSAAKGARKFIWIGTVSTSAGAGLASGFVVNRIGNEVRNNIMVMAETVVDGQKVKQFVQAPRGRLGIAINPEDRKLQLMGLATEIAGGLIMAAVVAATLNVELGTKEDDPVKEDVNG
jgi:hypothetical protein